VEPNLSKQWFVSVKPLAEKAIDAVKNGHARIIPEIWANTYYDWMNNIRDWCVSRQIWWGHQIPAWTCTACGELIVDMEAPQTCPACNGSDLVQETDVLDTWFSSALWPFSTMGWPRKTRLLEIFYPTSVLVTGFDILFFWVARMMMMGIHFMKDVPFRDVYVHALVRDAEGKKMSKSKGNVIDPLSVIDTYGTDAFRFTLAAFAAQGRDIKMSEQRIQGYRHFINKLWNAARLSLMHIDKDYTDTRLSATTLPDRWILSRLHEVTRSVESALDTYRFNDAAGLLYNFVWHEFCDWYLEAIKPILYGKSETGSKETTLAVLGTVLRNTLILLHPFIPFVTEEIWHQLPGAEGSIMRAAFPSDQDAFTQISPDAEAEAQMALLTQIITGVRNVRGELDLAPALALDVIVQSDDATIRRTIDTHTPMITNLARVKSLVIENPGKKPASAATTLIDGAAIFVPLEGVIDFNKESERLQKRIAKVNQELDPMIKKLNNADFLQKAPENVVQKTQTKHSQLLETLHKLESTLAKIQSLAE
jgi:valyl-tRNA synthetase